MQNWWQNWPAQKGHKRSGSNMRRAGYRPLSYHGRHIHGSNRIWMINMRVHLLLTRYTFIIHGVTLGFIFQVVPWTPFGCSASTPTLRGLDFQQNGWDNAQKCAYLVSLSTTTMMTLFPSDLGKPVIKSIETSSQRWLGMSKGCNKPGVLIVSTLFCWQTKHFSTNFWISDLRPSQKNSFLTLW